MSPSLFGALMAMTVLTAAVGIAAMFWWARSAGQSQRVQRRLLSGSQAAANDFESAGVNPLLQGIATRGKAIDQLLDSKGAGARLMIRAGWRSTGSRLAFNSFQLMTPLLLLAGVAVFRLAGPARFTTPFFLVLAAAAAIMLGLLLPSRVRARIAATRQRRLRAEVPLFIHTLVLLFESGLSTRQALASLVREGRGVLRELGTEIEVLLRQLEAGADMADALTRMGDVLDVPDLTTVLHLLRQVERYGGEVKEPLLDTLQVIEDRRSMDLREQVNLVSGRMTVVMVLFFFPALIIFVAGPAWVAVFQALSGVGK